MVDFVVAGFVAAGLVVGYVGSWVVGVVGILVVAAVGYGRSLSAGRA